MDIFPLQSRVAPIEAPVESLAVSGYSQGVRDAEKLPNEITQIAQAVTQGIESYQNVTDKAQEIELNEQRIESNKRLADLQADPNTIAAAKEEVQAKRDEYAESVKQRQRKDELVGVLQSGDTARIVGAVTSGEYADVFSADSDLEKYAIKVAAPDMSEEQRDSFLYQQDARQTRLMYQRNALNLANQEAAAEKAFIGNKAVAGILADYSDMDVRSLARRARIEPSGRFEYQGEKVVVDPITKRFKQLPPDKNEEGELKDRYDVIDRTTGRVLRRGISKEDAQVFQTYKGTAAMVPNSALQETEQAKTLRSAIGQKSSVNAPSKKPTTAPTGKVSAPKPGEAAAYKVLEQQVGNVPVTTAKGTAEPATSEFIAANVVSTLELPEETKTKYLPRVKDVVERSLKASSDLDITSSFSKIQEVTTLAGDQIELAKDILSDQWNSLSQAEELNKSGKWQRVAADRFTQADVDKHNKEVEEYEAFIRRQARGEFSGRTFLYSPGTYAASPKDLFVQKKMPTMLARLNGAISQVQKVGKAQLKARAKKGVAQKQILAATGDIL